VRETWAVGKLYDDVRPRDLAKYNDASSQLAVDYKADVYRIWGNTGNCGKTRPSIFMPRWASRITLEVVAVRVERLQDITEADAKAEGVTGALVSESGEHAAFVPAYALLWDHLNAKRGYGWSVNPWVWVVTFRAGTCCGKR